MSGPKLLDKKVVNAELQMQRKQQIDLGLSLAKKVDIVRTSLEEETNKLEEFRINIIKQVQIEIDAFVRQKDSLIQEIRDRQEQLQILQIPLDSKWKEVNEAEEICNERKIELDGYQEHIDQERKEIGSLKKEVEFEMGRATDFKHRASEELIQAQTTLENARESAAATRNQAHAVLLEAELKLQVAIEKEEEIEMQEKELQKEKDRLIPWEVDLVKREKKLKSQWETFLKSQNYLKNKK